MSLAALCMVCLFGLGARAQDIRVEINGYLGHDGGASCGSGVEVIREAENTPVTYCVSVTNLSSVTSFSSVTLTIPYLGVTNVLGPIGPNGSFSTFFETNILEDVVIIATVSATPALGGPDQTDNNDVFVDAAEECPSDCFVVSDVNNASGQDRLYTFNTETRVSTLIGSISTPGGEQVRCLESLVFEPPVPNQVPKLLYSVESCRPSDPNNGYLGTIDWQDPLVDPLSVPGTFRDVGGPIGVGTGLYNGVLSSFNMIDIDGLDFDRTGTNVILYASVRLDGANAPDLLIQINTNTGSIVHGAFGGLDFVQIGPVTTVVAGVTNILYDVDDIAINAAGLMYGVANNSGTSDQLIQIDKFTGNVIASFPLRDTSGASFNDMEGLSFSPIDDIFYGTTGSAGGFTANSLFQISLAGTNAGFIVENAFGPGTNSVVIPGTGDYEGSDCFLVTPEAFTRITGVTFWDKEEDGDYDGVEQVVPGAFVFLFEDLNTNGVLDIGTDLFVNFTPTDANGFYEFIVAIGKSYIVVLDETSLPPEACALTTASQFPLDVPALCGINVRAPDFGVAPCSWLGDRVWDDLNQNGVQDPGEPGIPGVTVNVYHSGGAFVDTTVTGPLGDYLFTNLNRSNYYIEVIAPGAYVFTTPNVGSDLTDSDIDPVTGLSADYDLSVFVPDPGLVYSNITADAGLYLVSDYAITKDFGAVLPGNSNVVFEYTLLVENLGDRTGTVVSVSDTLPAGLDYLADDAGGTYDPLTRLWSLDLLDFAPGSSTSVVLTVAVTNNLAGTLLNTACVTNALPEASLTNNCDDASLAFLGDRVWLDINENGIQEPGEPGIPNVTVELYDAATNLLASTVTDGSGFYGFSLPPGTYLVRFAPPANTLFTTQNVGPDDTDSDADPLTGFAGPITLLEGQSDDTVDAGLLAPLTVEKLAGPTLLSTTNVTFAYLITVTNAGDLAVDPVLVEDVLPVWAEYVGSSEPGATYDVPSRLFSVDVGPLPPFGSATISVTVQVVNATAGLDLSNTASVNRVVFDTQTNAFLGDLFFLDSDGSNTQTPGDSVVPGATINLYDAASNQVGSTTTDGAGLYAFILPPGTYFVEFEAPAGSPFVLPDQGGDDALDSDADPLTGRTPPVTLLEGDIVDTLDAGVGNNLTLDKATSEAFLQVTNVTFDYLITVSNASALPADPVLVEDILPDWANFLGSPTPGLSFDPVSRLVSVDVGPLAGLASTTVVVNVEVTGTVSSLDLVNTARVNQVIEALQTNVFIGDLVFQDINTNDVYDVGTDIGVPGVTVELLNAALMPVASTVTDANGLYGFIAPPGTYSVRFLPPAGTDFVTPNVGADDTVDSDADVGTGITPSVTLAEGEIDTTLDAGLRTRTTLDKQVSAITSTGGAVRFDYLITVSNASAIASAPILLEDPLPVWATYLSDNGAGGSVVGGVYSNALGSIAANTATSIVVSVEVSGAAANLDLTNTASVDRVIFASQTNAFIGDYVWRDGNANGIQDIGEIGVPGVTVQLLDAATNILADTVTDVDGAYGFIVPPGTYLLRFVPPGGTDFSPRFAGGPAEDSDADLATGLTNPVVLAPGQIEDTLDAGLVTPLTLLKSVETPLGSVSNVTFNYILTVSNASVVPADPVLVEDILPDWVQYISDDAGGGMVGNTYTNAVGPLAGNGSRTIRILVQVVNPQFDSDLVNTASVNRAVFATQTNALIGDLVFEDSNRDGLQTGESGIPGIPVELWNSATNVLYGSTVTDANGNYLFIVPPGDYRVRVLPPASHAISPQDVGADDSIDSDIDPLTATTATVTLLPGEVNRDADAGLFTLVPAIDIQKTVTDGATCPGVDFLQGLAGTPINYCFVITNTGETRLANVTITDVDLLAAPIVLPGVLEIGQSVTTSVATVMTVDLVNTAQVTGTPVDENDDPIPSLTPPTDQDDAEVDVILPGILLEKTVYTGHDAGLSCPGLEYVLVRENDPITYCFTISNTGDVALVNVTLTDTNLTPNVLINLGNLPAFSSTSVFVEVFAADSLINTARVEGVPPAGPPVTSVDTAEVEVIRPAIRLEKTVFLGWDAGASCPGVEQVSGLTGDELTYCFLVENIGDSILTNIVVSDPLIGPVTLLTDTLLPGESTSGYVETLLSTSVVNVAVATGIPPVGPPVTDTNTASVVRIPPAVIGDFVWNDLNADGVQDGGEPGLIGVRVYIDSNTNGVFDPGEPFEITDGAGGYVFTNVAPGTVTVRVDPSTVPLGAGFVNSFDPDSNFDSASTITVASGETRLDQDFGYMVPFLIVDTTVLCIDDAAYVEYTVTPVGVVASNGVDIAWIDATNGVREVLGGQPLAGTLLWPGTVLGPDGVVDWPGWVFTNGVWEVENDGLRPTMTLAFTVNPTATNSVDYPSATPFCSANPRALIGDFVWLDLDGDGIQDPGEPGVPGVIVRLIDNDSIQPTLVTTTDVNGVYTFMPRLGSFTVEFDLATLPPNTQVGPQDQGLDDELDSDPDPLTGIVPTAVVVTAGVVNVTVDMSVVPLQSIGDTVWYDVNGNGIPDENLGIFGIPGVTVSLFEVPAPGVTNLLLTTTSMSVTNNLGYYIFTNLPPALYSVVIDESTLPPQLDTPTTPPSYLVDLRIPGTPTDLADFGYRPDPTAIELLSFTADQVGAGVLLRWTTGVEMNTLGYNLLREGTDGARQRVNATLVMAQGAGAGASYAFTDANVPVGTWRYWLEELETDLDSALYGPVEITTVVVAPDAPIGDGFVVEKVGLARVAVDNPDTTAVLVNDVEVPALVQGNGLLVYVAAANSAIRTEASDEPLRMETLSSAPQDGQTAILVADGSGQAVFTTVPGTDNYLLIGFASTEIVVLDVSDPTAPLVLTETVLLDMESDAGVYLRLVPEEPARVHAADPRAVIEITP